MFNLNNKIILPIIVLSQFLCTSLWFAGNAIVFDLQKEFLLDDSVIGHITSAVQFGFIAGTLTFAFLTISDRFSPSKVFFVCAFAGALFNLGILIPGNDFFNIITFRVLTGFMLAGIYPVGMKIAADYHEKGLGKALGFLVGALALGTSFPHLIRNVTEGLPYKFVLISTSLSAVAGGLLILLFVADGPYRKKSRGLDLLALFKIFKIKEFRAAAFGYFGHMWEVYSFWAFIPVIIFYFMKINGTNFNISLLTFGVIAAGGVACMIGGYFSLLIGSWKTAFAALLFSGICCLISPFIFNLSPFLFLLILFLWGMAVAADSPQFSSLVAASAPKETIGTALTIVNCIGFAITIVSLQVINHFYGVIDLKYIFLILAPGPILGLIGMSFPKKIKELKL